METTTEAEPKYTTHWMSECGSFSMCHFIAESPYMLSQCLSKIIGDQRMPPLFSIGYHQCRWNYFTKVEVMELNENFKKNNLPMDTIWLDIEYSDRKKYMVWDPHRFANADEMCNELKRDDRYLVAIVDPHISTEKEYHVIKESSENGFLLKSKPTQSSADYVAKCWAPECSWIDFFNPKACEFWTKCLQYDMEFSKGKENMYIWEDMNEPSVFDVTDTTAPKGLGYLFYIVHSMEAHL